MLFPEADERGLVLNVVLLNVLAQTMDLGLTFFVQLNLDEKQMHTFVMGINITTECL